jgi:hypothetical protein
MLCINNVLKAQQNNSPTKASAQNKYYGATIAGLKGGVISKAILLKAGKIEFSDTTGKIVSFKMTTLQSDSLVERISQNNELTIEMKNDIKLLQSGSKIYFENIKLFYFGAYRTISSMIFKLE